MKSRPFMARRCLLARKSERKRKEKDFHFKLMSLSLATLIPGLLLAVLGLALLANNSGVVAVLKGLPRSAGATYLFFGGGAVGFSTGSGIFPRRISATIAASCSSRSPRSRCCRFIACPIFWRCAGCP